MPLTVEDGTGLPTAEAYISVADADQYFTDHNVTVPTEWSGASEAVKETALRIGARALDLTYQAQWLGMRVTTTQGLAWPRVHVEDADGFLVDSDSVPVAIQHANAELALRELQTGLLSDVTGPGDIKREKQKLGDLETDREYAGSKRQTTVFTVVESLIKPFVSSAFFVERG